MELSRHFVTKNYARRLDIVQTSFDIFSLEVYV